MGIKRRILSSGRKFITKHKTFYDKAMAVREAAGDESVWVESVGIVDLGNEKFTFVVTTEGDFENNDWIYYSLDTAGSGSQVAAHAKTITSPGNGSGGVSSVKGSRELTCHVRRNGTHTVAVAKSSKSKSFTLAESKVVLDPTHAHFARDDGADNLKIKIEATAATGQIPLENLNSWGLASHKYKVEVRLNTSAGDLVALDHAGTAGMTQIDATTTYAVAAGSAAELTTLLAVAVGAETTFFVKITPSNAAGSAYHEASAASKTITVAKQ